MSRQNKARQKAITAKQFSEIRKNGGSGPARTTPKHGKVNTVRALEAKKRAADAEKATAQTEQRRTQAKPARRSK